MSDQFNIRQIREDRGWTQSEMATYFGVDKATYWRWENRGVPRRGPARQAIERAIGALTTEGNTEQGIKLPHPIPDVAAS